MLANYTEKKTRNQGGVGIMDKHLPPKTFKRYCECGNWIEIFADRENTKYKVYQSNFCKNRFCPMCAWRLAHKDAMKISVLMKYLEAEHGKEFILLTLTAPNVLGVDLKNEIARYNKAFKKLVERDEVARILKNNGYIRKLEITYNKERNDYHPHFHVLIAVNKRYFNKRDKQSGYIKQARWLDLWREVMGDESITQVDVRKVNKHHEEDGTTQGKAVNEIAKYAAKDEEYFHSQAVFDVFYNALKGRQVLTYSGIFAEANKLYKQKMLEEYKTEDETEYVWLLLARWGGSEYIEKKRRQISREEYLQLKRVAVDETAGVQV